MAAGALVALTIGWPLTGVISALVWPRVFDAKGPADRAVDRLLLAQEGSIISVVPYRRSVLNFFPPDCLGILGLAGSFEYRKGNDRSIADLNREVLNRLNSDNYNDAERVTIGSMNDLSFPALGFLQGCVLGSLLAEICDGYVTRRVDAALSAHAKGLHAGYIENVARARRIACRALKGVDAADRLPD